LRFAYLIDFLSLEALSGIYLGSVDSLVCRLRILDQTCNIDELMEIDIDEANKQPAAPVRGKDPIFHIKLELDKTVKITDKDIVSIEIDDFKPPPHGTSTVSDFNLEAHLEVEPEKEDSESGSEFGDAVEKADPLFVKKYK
jgi:hypothetical protein